MAGGFLPPVVAELVAKTDKFTAGMAKARGELDATTNKGSSAFGKLAAVGKVAFFAIGAAAVGVGVSAVKMADDFEGAHARLEVAIKNSGSAIDKWSSQIDAADSHMAKLGFNSTDTQSALATLVNVTHNTSKALSDLSLAADVARGRHIDLGSAVAILAKVETGHVALLGRLGIATKDATGKTISQEEAIKRLTALYGGSASTYSKTFAGKMQALDATAHNLGVQLGLFLVPKIEKVASTFADTVQWFNKNRVAAEALAAVIGTGLVIAMGAFLTLKIRDALRGIGEAFDTLRGVMLTTRVEGEATSVALSGIGAATLGVGAAIGGLAIVYELISRRGNQVTKSTNEIVTAMKAESKTAQEIAAQQLADYLGKHGQLVTVLQHAGISLGVYKAAVLGSGVATDEVRKKLDKYLAAVNAGNTPYKVTADEANRAYNNVSSLKGKIDLTTQGIKNANEQVARTKAVNDAVATSVDHVTTKSRDLFDVQTRVAGSTKEMTFNANIAKAALENLRAEEERLFDKSLDVADGQRNVARAELQVAQSLADAKDKQKAYNDLLKQNKGSTAEGQQALRDYQAALIDVGQANDDAIRAIQDLAAKQVGASDAAAAAGGVLHDKYLNQLEQIAQTLAPTSPLRANLEAYIHQLGGVPPKVDTNFTADTGTAVSSADRLHREYSLIPPRIDTTFYLHINAQDFYATLQTAQQAFDLLGHGRSGPPPPKTGSKNGPAAAAGGDFPYGQIVKVGELGQEYAQFTPRGVHVYPHGTGPAMGNTLNVTYQILVKAGMGTNGTQVGTQIVEALKAHQRANGPLPLKVSA